MTLSIIPIDGIGFQGHYFIEPNGSTANGVPNIVEVNPLPGILPNPEDNSCLPKAARADGLAYDELIQSALLAAAARYGLKLDERLATATGSESPRNAQRPSPNARLVVA